MKILILEDNEDRNNSFIKWFNGHELIMTDNAMKAIDHLASIKFDVIFLDHDLDNRVFIDSNEPNTGYTVAKTISSTINKSTQVIVHSMNPIGARNMLDVLGESNQAFHRPFGVWMEKIL